MPRFSASYPGSRSLLTIHERIGALSDYAGRGVVMAFIDAGFYPHPEIAGRVLVHVDAGTDQITEQTGTDYDSGDLGWHGQMTTVIAAGDGRLSGGRYRGIASEAQLVLVRVGTPRGQVKEPDILRGLNWLADNCHRFQVRVVNISVGGDFVCDDPDHPIYAVIRKLTAAGVVVVAAAGNRAQNFMVPPASATEAITVGGLDDQNVLDESHWRLYHSNYGQSYSGQPKPDLIAPARWVVGPIMPETSVAREARWLGPLLQSPDDDEIRRLLRRGYADLGLTRRQVLEPDANLYAMLQARINAHKIVDAHHQHVDGTSVAAPVVSAVIAQMLQINPRLTPEQIRSILCATARPLADYPPERQGSGVIRPADALAQVSENTD
ncbi:MAG TPA: S8 family serine peptidase [Spirillospora sp.]|nr:S8 family serine peptidase [Spirillospora sp.]